MSLQEFQVSPFFLAEEGHRSIDMRYTTLSGSTELHLPSAVVKQLTAAPPTLAPQPQLPR
jgi:hypothetical protein